MAPVSGGAPQVRGNGPKLELSAAEKVVGVSTLLHSPRPVSLFYDCTHTPRYNSCSSCLLNMPVCEGCGNIFNRLVAQPCGLCRSRCQARTAEGHGSETQVGTHVFQWLQHSSNVSL